MKQITGPALSRRGAMACVLATAMVCLIGGTRTSSADENAEAFILDLSKRAIASLTDQSIDPVTREDRFRTLLREALDMNIVSERVLGVYRKRATPEIMSDLMPVLEETIVLTYAKRFENYNGETIAMKGSREGRRETTIVKTSVTQTSGGPEIPVEWHLRMDGDSFRIVDIVVQGNFSMIATHRDQYVAVINKAGGDIGALIDALRKNNERLTAARQ